MYFDTLKFSLSFLIFSLASRFYAGSRPAASHSVRSTQSEEQPNSLDRCALWPGRPWTGLVGPWTAGTAASGCTLTAHRPTGPDHRRPARGLSPPTPPGRPKGRRLFEISPEARKPSGPAALRAALAPPAGRQAAGARRAGARQGAQPRGAGGRHAPPPWSRPRRRAGRRKRSAQPTEGWAKGGQSPPSGGLVSWLFPRSGPTLIADKHSRSLCL